jgi:hypothetical protein
MAGFCNVHLPLNKTGFFEIRPVLVMCTVFLCECDSSTRLRGKNRKQPITKKAFGFYSVLVSPVLIPGREVRRGGKESVQKGGGNAVAG